MANTYKNIVITPNTGSTTGDPTIVFSGGDSSTNTDIELVVYPTSNGTLSFEGTAGQLFSITNDLSNTIFSVNDVSGLPLIEVNVASQQITLGQYYGNVGIGTAAGNSSNYKLDVAGGANISLPNLTVGGTNVIAAIVASNANAVTLSANVNTLAAAVVAANSTSTSNNASQGANIAVLAASFVSNSQTLSANVNVLAATFAAANANNISLSANVNTLAGAITNLTLENMPSAFVKRSVTAATTANIALYGTQTIDGVAVVAGNRVLVKDQTLANQNGLYVVSATAWSRSVDADIIGDIASALVAVDTGTVNGGRLYDNDTKLTDTLNTTNIVWGRVIDDGAIYTYAAPVTAYGALNVAYLAANTNAATLAANVNVLAAAYVSNSQTQGANIAVLAATFVSANANSISLSANVNTLAATFAAANANNISLSANVNTLAATFAAANANSISLSANVNTLAATFAAANANNISLSANVNLIAGLITNLTLENLPSAFVKKGCRVATTADLAASVYNNGTSGVGATLTGYSQTVALAVSTTATSTTATTTSTAGIKAGATISGNINIPAGTTVSSITNATTFVMSQAASNTVASVSTTFTNTLAALSVDGVTLALNDRVLVKDQSTIGGIADASGSAKNGIYYLSTLGTTAVAWVLTRSLDADSVGDISSAIVAIDQGTTNGGKLYDNDYLITSTMGTTAMAWNRIIDDVAIYTYAAPVTAYGALNVAYLAANTNATSLSTNVNTLAATFAAANANNISLSANVNTLAATFAAANANNISLSANVAVLATAVSGKLANTSGTSFGGSLFITSLGVGTAASGVTGEIRALNNITAYYSSDRAFKENIKPIQNALKKVMSVDGVEFDWTKEYIEEHGGEDGYFVRKHDVGVIAQDIEKVLPEVVATKQDGTKAVKYDRIVALLIEAIKDQQEQIDELKRLKSNN